LIKKLKEIKMEWYDWDIIFEKVLEIISMNTYHSHKIVWPKKIYYELAWLIQVCKQEIEKQKSKWIPQFTSL